MEFKVQLLYSLHDSILEKLCEVTDAPHAGIAQAARSAKRQGLVGATTCNKLVSIDFSYNFVRHLTQKHHDQFLCVLSNEILSNAHVPEWALAASAPHEQCEHECEFFEVGTDAGSVIENGSAAAGADFASDVSGHKTVVTKRYAKLVATDEVARRLHSQMGYEGYESPDVFEYHLPVRSTSCPELYDFRSWSAAGDAVDTLAEKAHAEGDYAEGEHAGGERAEGDYAEGEHAGGDYAEGAHAEGDYAEGEHAGGERAEGDYAEGEHAGGDYAEGEHAGEATALAEGAHTEGDFAEGAHAGGGTSDEVFWANIAQIQRVQAETLQMQRDRGCNFD